RENKKYLPHFKLPENINLTSDIAKACAGATLFVNAIPTQHIRAVFDKFADYLPVNSTIVSTAKGIERDTLLLPTQIIADALNYNKSARASEHSLAALSGPSIALEIAQKK